MRNASFVLVLLAVVFTLSGCGSSSSETQTTTTASPTVQWADGLCSALLTYKDAIQAAGATLKSGAVSGDAIDEATSSVTGATRTSATTSRLCRSPSSRPPRRSRTR